MTVVDQWTGVHAHCLREALRLSQRQFAAWLGVAHRTVVDWEARGFPYVPRQASQEVLDSALKRADPDVRERFWKRLDKLTDTARPADPTPSVVGTASAERAKRLAAVLSGASRYLVPRDVVESIRRFLTGHETVLMLTGGAGTGKTRMSYHVCTAVADLADVQWHPASSSAWSGTVTDAAASILRFGSVAVDSDPLISLDRTVSELERPLLVVIDGVAEQVAFKRIADQVDTILRQVTGTMLRFLLTVRTPPEVSMSAWPVLAAGSTTVEIGPWSPATVRTLWSDLDPGVAFDDLPASVRELARTPLFFHLLTADPCLPRASTFELIGRAVKAAVPGEVHNGYVRLAYRRLREVIPESLRPPPEAPGEAVPESAVVRRVDGTAADFSHDVFAEHVAAVHLAGRLSQWGRGAAAVELLNTVARHVAASATGLGLLDQLAQALEHLGVLTGIARSPLADAQTTLPHLVRAVPSGEVVKACAPRCASPESIELAREILTAPSLTTVVGPDWTHWWLGVLEAIGRPVWDAAAWAVEHTLTAGEAADLLEAVDPAHPRQATWTARHLHLLTNTHHRAVTELVAHPGRQVRAAAAMSLGSVGHPATWPADLMATLIGDRDDKVRAAAATALGPAQLRRHLGDLLSDDSWYVRGRCLESVLRAESPEINDAAIALLLPDPSWARCPADARRFMERLLVLHDPERHATACPQETWRLLRETRTGATELPPETVTVLRGAATTAPTWVQRREATLPATDTIGPVIAPCTPQTWRRLRGRRHIQVTLDLHSLGDAAAIAQAVAAAGCGVIAIGDPLIKSHGAQAISRVKERVPTATVVAELMSTDRGRDQVDLAATAGADAVLLIGPMSPASVADAALAGHRYGVPVTLDVPATAGATWIRDMENAGVDGLTVTDTVDLEAAGQSTLQRAQHIRRITRLPVGVSGGFGPTDDLGRDWDILIVGRAITEAAHPDRMAHEFVRLTR